MAMSILAPAEQVVHVTNFKHGEQDDSVRNVFMVYSNETGQQVDIISDILYETLGSMFVVLSKKDLVKTFIELFNQFLVGDQVIGVSSLSVAQSMQYRSLVQACFSAVSAETESLIGDDIPVVSSPTGQSAPLTGPSAADQNATFNMLADEMSKLGVAAQQAIIIKLQANISKSNQSSAPVGACPAVQGGSYLPTPTVQGLDIATPGYASLGTRGLGQNSKAEVPARVPAKVNFDLGSPILASNMARQGEVIQPALWTPAMLTRPKRPAAKAETYSSNISPPLPPPNVFQPNTGFSPQVMSPNPSTVSQTHVWGHNSVPRVTIFTGEAKDQAYDQWRYEVKALVHDGVPEHLILQAIRRSLKGMAASAVMQMGEDVSVSGILDQFNQLFGNVLPAEVLLEQLLSAKQTEEESITAWACRLNDLKLQINLKDSSMLAPSMAEQTMRTKFWSGLFRADIRNAIRHRKDGGASYSELLAAARTVECESQDKKPVKSHQATADVTLDTSMAKTLEKIFSLISGLDQRLSAKADDHTHRGQRSGYQRIQPGNDPPPGFHHSGAPQPAPSGRPNSHPYGSTPRGPMPYTSFRGSCHNCGQIGHMQRNCPLNSSQSAMRGNPSAVTGNAPIRR